MLHSNPVHLRHHSCPAASLKVDLLNSIPMIFIWSFRFCASTILGHSSSSSSSLVCFVDVWSNGLGPQIYCPSILLLFFDRTFCHSISSFFKFFAILPIDSPVLISCVFLLLPLFDEHISCLKRSCFNV
jgi:hypothetical protein